MQIERVKISTLIPDPSNARKHDQKNLDAIKGSLAKFGKQTERFFSRIEKNKLNDCWEFSEIQYHTGYGKFHSNGVTWRAHRWIMYALGHIKIKDERCVLHNCDNRSCVNPNHLRLGDRYENAQDIKIRNRTHLIRDPKLGSKNPQAKLNESIIIKIRNELNLGMMGKDLSKKYNVSRSTISEIKNKKIWSHI